MRTAPFAALTGNECQGALPCPLCTKPLPVRVAKSRKPYFVCNSCGVQLFVRRREGIESLSELLRNLQKHNAKMQRSIGAVADIQSTLLEIRGIKTEIKNLDLADGVFFKDRDFERARKALRQRLKNAIRKLNGAESAPDPHSPERRSRK